MKDLLKRIQSVNELTPQEEVSKIREIVNNLDASNHINHEVISLAFTKRITF